MNSPEKLERIEEWLRRTAYLKRAEAIKDLGSLCSEKYAMIAGLCKDGREFAFRQFGTTVCQKETRRPLSSTESAVLPIELVSAPGADFKEELFSRKQAWITVEYSDGHSKCNLWRIGRLTRQSNIVGNLRSRPAFRSGKWQKLGIVRVSVTLSPPGQ